MKVKYANICPLNKVFTLEYDPAVHDRTWQNLIADGNYSKVMASMIKYLLNSKKWALKRLI